ncbi:hypothetical protein ABIB48_002655 [Arthrobacter sp. UYCu511]|uniref:hypothetical protein n=1 Tax=Arthrobacter sp. UYCu511 TaxID=3156337 RepID=UPI0033941156
MSKLSISTTDNGLALFTGYNHKPDGDPFEPFVVAAIRGASKARAAWLAHNEAAKKIMARIAPSAEIVLQARRDRAAQRITQAQLDAAEAAHLEIYADAKAHAAEGRKLARAYADLIEGSTLDRQQLAASVIAENTPKLAEALDTIEELYATTRRAYEVAGKPGRDPHRITGADERQFDGGFSVSLRALRALVSFDVDAAAAAAEGAEVITQADLDAMQLEREAGELASLKLKARAKEARSK